MMKTYKTIFNRFHSSTWDEQTVEIIVETDIPFEDEYLEEFEKLFWSKLFELYPHWGSGLPLINGKGWSSALSSGRYELINTKR